MYIEQKQVIYMVVQEIHRRIIKMKDMLETLRKAKQKKVFMNQQEFKDVLTQIRLADAELKLDWDDGAGEEWARFSNLTDGIVCMVNVRLRLAFIREKYNFQNIKQTLESFEIVFTENYYSDEWSIDVTNLKKEISEIHWHASEEAVNRNCFSLDDFYFATV